MRGARALAICLLSIGLSVQAATLRVRPGDDLQAVVAAAAAGAGVEI